jgi:hypothetical protein
VPYVCCVACGHTGSNSHQCPGCGQPFSNTATGFDLEPLPNGDVLIQFFADDGKPINTQLISRTALAQFPAVIHALFLAVEKGKDAAIEFFDRLTANDGGMQCNDSGTKDNHSGGDQ